MKNLKKITLLIFVCLYACNSKGNYIYSEPFDQKLWMKHNDIKELNNPRAKMVNDLIRNHLKKGMAKSEIINLLGNPYFDGIQSRLPKGMKAPDSLDLLKTIGKSKKIRQDVLDKWNKWYLENSQPDTLLLYAAGWSLMDPNSLAIRLNDKNIAYEFWLKQH